MSLEALKATLHSRRFWIWQLAGAAIYAIPALIRITTGNVLLPGLSLLATPWVGHYIPANLIEKIIVNSFFPGAAGAVAGEIYFGFRNGGEAVSKRQKYLWRLAGAMVWVSLWSLFQLIGYLAAIMGTWGGNLFEYPGVYPLNFGLAAASVFTPTWVGYLAQKLARARTKKEG